MRSLSVASPVLLLLVCAPIVCANTITVTGHGDSLVTDGVCTLREALINANNNAATWPDCAAGSGADVINLPAGTITLSTGPRGDEVCLSGDLDVLDSVTINGDPAGSVVDAAGIDRVFDFNPKANPFDSPRPAITVNLNNLTIKGGSVQGDGGGFRVDENATVNANGVTVTGNTGNNDGGGVKVEGGGILNMTNCTISGNSVSLLYAGLRSDGTTALTNCTVTNNSESGLTTATRGNGLGGSGITLRNTIVAGNGSGGPDTEGGFTSLGYNIIGNLGIGTTITATTGDQFSVSASSVDLGPLQNNGGPTSTHALGAGSIAIDKGDSSGSTTDQRGQPRPCDQPSITNATGGDGADIGAFEVQGTCAPPNSPPVANNDSATVLENSGANVIDVLANDSDPDGDALTITAVTQGAHGSVVNNTSNVSYTPGANFFGTDSFTYTISDGHGNTATATVTVRVDSPPVAVNDSYSVNQNTTLNVAAPGVLGNDTDADGDPLTAALVSGPSHGSLTFHADGSFSYTPVSGFACHDSFTYKANDGFADSNVATVSITVNDTAAPAISVSTSTAMLWPPNHDLINVGLAFSATDNGCSGTATTSVAVFSDEPDVTTADGDQSPDAKNIGAGTLRLRAERDARRDGRVYLIQVTATDPSNNTSHQCAAVVVPKSLSAADVASVDAQAAAAVAQCSGSGLFPVGVGPTIGPKQ